MAIVQSPEPPQEEESPRQPRNPLVTWFSFLWNRYSPNGEMPISTAASTAFHILVFALIPLFALALVPPDKTAPAVDVIRVADAPEAASDDGLEFSPEDGLEMKDPSPTEAETPPEVTPTEQVNPVDQFQAQEKVPTNEGRKQQLDDAARRATDAIRRANDALNKLNDKLNHGASGNEGDRGQGTERGARPARWVLHFRTDSTRDYLTQIEGLKAVIAFPGQGDKWRFFSKPASAPGESELKSLYSENRLYWKDSERDSVRRVTDHLNVPNAPFITLFLPIELEDKMLRLELQYNNLEEDEILSTHFEVVTRGGGYDVRVVEQISR